MIVKYQESSVCTTSMGDQANSENQPFQLKSQSRFPINYTFHFNSFVMSQTPIHFQLKRHTDIDELIPCSFTSIRAETLSFCPLKNVLISGTTCCSDYLIYWQNTISNLCSTLWSSNENNTKWQNASRPFFCRIKNHLTNVTKR